MSRIDLWPARLIIGLPILWLVLSLEGLQGATESAGERAATEQSPGELRTRVSELIEQLGAARYADRERARSELRRLRMEAFDALNEAQSHDDIEIALSARNLVRGMQVDWCHEEDPAEVKKLLRSYGNRQKTERRNLMRQLAELGREKSLAPLCRLVRYEASEILSKRAALLALGLKPPAPQSDRRRFAERVVEGMGTSRRAAAEWLRAYAKLLTDASGYHQRWSELISSERARLADTSDRTSKEIVQDLVRWYADQLLRLGRQRDALAMMHQSIDLLDAGSREVMDAADWFRDRRSWSVVVDLANRFSALFKRNPLLQYRLAESYRELEQDRKADAAAEVAFQAVPDEPESHLALAYKLQHEGLFEWAEDEYRHLVGQRKEQPVLAVQVHLSLSEMLHDIGSEQAAGEVLRELVQWIESDERIREVVENETRRDVASIRSRMYYFFAQQHARQGEYGRQRELLLKGCEHNPHDADVLIAMYRIPDPKPAWREKTQTRIREAIEFFRGKLKDLKEGWSDVDGKEKALTQLQLATTNNQLAWLIANTEGDLDEALYCSQMSLELHPDQPAGFLDTLGRCYYARGEYGKAVEYQSQAAAKDPHSPLILNQLELFQETLRQRGPTGEKAAARTGTGTKEARKKEIKPQ